MAACCGICHLYDWMLLPLLATQRWLSGGKQAALSFVGLFALASVVINVPLLLLAPTGWWHFFAFNASRGEELNLYTLLVGGEWLSPEEMNRVGILLLLWGLGVLLLIQRRLPPAISSWLPACCALFAWFFFLNKALSPQYDLWIVTLLALSGASPALAVAFSTTDLLYFAAHYARPVLLPAGTTEAQGFAESALNVAAASHEIMLLMVAGWGVWQMHRALQDNEVEGGKQRASGG